MNGKVILGGGIMAVGGLTGVGMRDASVYKSGQEGRGVFGTAINMTGASVAGTALTTASLVGGGAIAGMGAIDIAKNIAKGVK